MHKLEVVSGNKREVDISVSKHLYGSPSLHPLIELLECILGSKISPCKGFDQCLNIRQGAPDISGVKH